MTRLEREEIAEQNKLATENVILKLEEEIGVHFSDIEYADEFTEDFDYGTNSMVEFHIDECPNWKFAIWWNEPNKNKTTHWYKEKEYDFENIHGDFFAQHEFDIDKFKPSRSNNCTYVVADNSDINLTYIYEAKKMIEFIRDHSELAFCRDYEGWNYNQEFHTEKEAKKTFNNFVKWREKKIEKTEEYNNKLLAFVKEKIAPRFKKCFILDSGEDTSPRYDIVAELEENEDVVSEPGLYSWFEEDDEEGQKLLAEFNKLVKECEDDSEKYEFLWYSCIDDSILFHKKIVIDDIKEKSEFYKIIEV